MIPVEKVFLLFDDNIDLKDLEGNDRNSIYMKIGMFNKIIQNSSVIFLQVKNLFKANKTLEWDLNAALEITSNIVYNKSFFYIKDFNIEDEKHIDALKCFNYDSLVYNIDQSLKFFETKEEYEKCAFLFRIKNWIEEERRSLIP